ncbi:hypothetical protein TWF718_009130 [Orbilia javanica]|uniref:Uncharacterized protein n=1 Tax=Orbilia javanica TaxID=47235 RepID=A0AAN8MVK2_9PEZI
MKNNSGCVGSKVVEANLLNDIEHTIESTEHEASSIILQQVAKGRAAEAYFLADLLGKRDSYSDEAIAKDYHTKLSQPVDVVTSTYKDLVGAPILDRSVGLLYRWFKGTTAEPVGRFRRTKSFPPITEEEATRLYKTLRSVSEKCLRQRPGPRIITRCCSDCLQRPIDPENIYVRIDPPLLRYLNAQPTIGEEEIECTSEYKQGLSNLISAGNALQVADVMSWERKSLLQLILCSPKTDSHLLDRVEAALECGLAPNTLNLPDCFGEIPLPIQDETKSMTIFKDFPISTRAIIEVSKEELLRTKLVPDHLLVEQSESQPRARSQPGNIGMTPLMYALYTRRYTALYSIFSHLNSDILISQTSNTLLPDIISFLKPETNTVQQLLGPVHIAAWTYISSAHGHNPKHQDPSTLKLFSLLCQTEPQMVDALDFAIKTRNYSLLAVLSRVTGINQFRSSLATETLVSFGKQTQKNQASWGGWYSFSKEFGKMLQIVTNFEYFEPYTELYYIYQSNLPHTNIALEMVEEALRRDLAQTRENVEYSENSSREMYGRQAALSRILEEKPSQNHQMHSNLRKTNSNRLSVVKTTPPRRHELSISCEAGIPPGSTPLNYPTQVNLGVAGATRSNLSHLGKKSPHSNTLSPTKRRLWEDHGSKGSHGSNIMSLVSKASASTASSGVSVISFGGMPFVRRRGGTLNPEKLTPNEEPELMDIDTKESF